MRKNKNKYARQARVEEELAEIIESRRKHHRRSFTAEVNNLLKRAIDMADIEEPFHAPVYTIRKNKQNQVIG